MEFERLCRPRSIRVTAQRLAVYKALAENLAQEKVYFELEDATQVWAQFRRRHPSLGSIDLRQRGEDRVSSVQYMKFDTAGRLPVAVGVDLPELQVQTMLSDEHRAALREDLTC